MQSKHLSVLFTSYIRVRLVPSNMFKPSSNFLTDRSKAVLLLLIFFVICVSYHTVLPVHGNLVITCWERADLLTLLYVMFSCVFITFPDGVLGQVWYMIVWVPDLCLPQLGWRITWFLF